MYVHTCMPTHTYTHAYAHAYKHAHTQWTRPKKKRAPLLQTPHTHICARHAFTHIRVTHAYTQSKRRLHLWAALFTHPSAPTPQHSLTNPHMRSVYIRLIFFLLIPTLTCVMYVSVFFFFAGLVPVFEPRPRAVHLDLGTTARRYGSLSPCSRWHKPGP
jgi:hypothetical protein